ncbi:MAG: T9SS type A sorting domain-containing protein [Bacteroidales bacterium]|nr:T9SS type A sorting domain-containing protein [Bacteroidales bacterium]
MKVTLLRIPRLYSLLFLFTLSFSVGSYAQVAPELGDIESSALSYTEGDGAVQITGSITVKDGDGNLVSATITVTNCQSTEDVLTFTGYGGISGSWNAGTGILSLSGIASIENYQATLRSITYRNTSENPSSVKRIVSFTVYDGLYYSNTVSRDITVTPVNNPPVLAAISSTSINYTEGDDPVQITNSITVTDVDDVNMESATVSITSGYQIDCDSLAFTSTGGVSGYFEVEDGTLYLSGSASLTIYRTVLRSVTYQNTSDNPSTLQRTVSFLVNDGDDDSNTLPFTITIMAVNDAPILDNLEGSVLSYTEDNPAVDISDLITITDADDTNIESAVVRISSNYQYGQDILAFTNTPYITGTWIPASGRLNLTGSTTLDNYITALRNVSYQDTSDNPTTQVRTVSFTVYDGDANSNTETRNITVTPVDDAPLLSGIETSNLAYSEGDGAVNITATLSVADVDNTNLQSATVVIGPGYQSGEDTLLFTNANGITGTWYPGTGTLALTGNSLVANYQAALRNVKYENTSENPTATTRTITFRVNDGIENSNLQSRNIVVGSLNDPPELSNLETAPLAYTENAAPTTITATLDISDDDDTHLESATVQITTNYQNGEDTLSFTSANGITGIWNQTTGMLSLSGHSLLANYRTALRNVRYQNTSENPSALTRTVSFTVNDGDDPSNTLTRDITVIPVNDAPVLSGIEETPLSYIAGSGPANITSTISVSDTDNVTLASATVTITNRQSAEDRLRYTNANGINGNYNTGSGVLSLIGTASLANYRTALRSVQYENINPDNPNTTPRTVEFRVSDGTAYSNIQTRTISYVPTATISGGGIICSYQKDTIEVDLTGEPAWTITIQRTGGPLPRDTVISGISESPYSFFTSIAGTYTVINVADLNYTEGLVYGSATITVRPATTVKLTGSAFICPDVTTRLTLDFTGTAPWTFVLMRNEDDTTYTDITADPFDINVSKTGNYTVASLYDQFCTGDTTGSGTAVITEITSPKAVLSGVDTTCPGDTATLRVQLTGIAPFSITYLRNGIYVETIDDILESDYALKVVGNGIYTLSEVTDQIRNGCVSGTATVVHYAVPTATISGTGSICEHTEANLRVTLTGAAPWTFSYHRGTEVPSTIENVTSSPRFIPVIQEGTYTLVSVSDKYCNGTVSGNAQVTVTPAPVVTISGLVPAYNKDDKSLIPVFGNPENGSFTPPLWEINDTNYFSPYYYGIGVHTFIYSFRDPATGCYGYDTAIVTVMSANAEITFPENDTKKLFCSNDSCFTIVANNIANVIGTFTISAETGLVDNGDNTATIDPSQLNGGYYTVTYEYYDEGMPFSVQERFEVEFVPDLEFVNFDYVSFCHDNDQVKLTANPLEGVFTGPAVTGNIISGFYYNPQLAQSSPDTVFYTFTAPKGCYNRIFKALTIYDVPNTNFTVGDTCIYAGITDSTAFINLTTSTDPIQAWLWYFDDDQASGGDNYSTLKNPKHLYKKAERRDVKLTATTIQGCSSEREITFYFGDKPTADFSWNSECFHEGKKIEFTNESGFNEGVITQYQWKIFNGITYSTFNTENAEYTFTEPDNYDVELMVTTNKGCTDTIIKTLPLKPTHSLVEGASYFEGFESGAPGWIKDNNEDISAVNSWNLSLPQPDAYGKGFNGAARGEYAWWTDITKDKETGRAPLEQSWITSPCFDFDGIKKPMIKFDIWRYFEEERDGAVLQYKSDDMTSWKNIGDLDDGINWYLNYKISGNPGGQPIGWSQKQDSKYVSARHSIDELKGKQNVQFRLAYGSDGTAIGTHGFAFDNMEILERSKISLIEHFTNASDLTSRSADSALDALANLNPWDIIDIQYHTSFPGVDPFNEHNKVDPGTRVLFYQLTSVPMSILNGGTTGEFRFEYIDEDIATFVKKQSLLKPKFSLDITSTLQNNSLNVIVEFRPLEVIMDKQVTLHIAVIERMVTDETGANGDTLFESVLKTILSSTSYTNNWDPEMNPVVINKNWNLKYTYNTDEIRVVAFIQDESTREVYQAAIDKYDLHVGIKKDNTIHLSNSSNGFIVFPNPVYNEACLRFDETLNKEARIDLFDINGKLVMTKELFPGTNQYAVTMDDCPNGFYFIRITSDNQFIGLQKLVISR